KFPPAIKAVEQTPDKAKSPTTPAPKATCMKVKTNVRQATPETPGTTGMTGERSERGDRMDGMTGSMG
ncbi:hypothetical protein ACFTY7_45745, partial [Streptomyces sp. NPDC057062]|uniref:hypothetical protein n=1 Tax=Streptomyces sp. NPDC057062 TaxID=3346011 RepID=UPI00362EF89A